MDNIRSQWNPMAKLAFRSIFCYYLLYLFPFPLDYLPFNIGVAIKGWVTGFWDKLVPAFGNGILGISEALTSNGQGSGDTAFHYVQVLAMVIIAVLGAVFWTLLDSKRKNDVHLYRYMILGLRYYLAFTLFAYGFSKVFANQFWPLSLTDLLKPYGASSPMGLLWKFMGYSEVYMVFAGIAEVIAGVLLVSRKTVRLGAFISFAIMLNVFVLNMSYDVPVKLYSAHLLVISAIILSPHIKNFIRFFVLNKTAETIAIEPYFKQKKWQVLGLVLKSILLIFIVGSLIQKQIKNQKTFGKKAVLPVLYGIYEVDLFVLNHDTIPPLTSDPFRWKRLVVDKFGTSIVKMDESSKYANNHVDTTKSIMYINPFPNDPEYQLNYILRDSTLSLHGYLQSDTLEIQLVKKSRNDFYLTKRGFHWINKYPMNR